MNLAAVDSFLKSLADDLVLCNFCAAASLMLDDIIIYARPRAALKVEHRQEEQGKRRDMLFIPFFFGKRYADVSDQQLFFLGRRAAHGSPDFDGSPKWEHVPYANVANVSNVIHDPDVHFNH